MTDDTRDEDRRRMVDLIRRAGVRDPDVLAAMEAVPRDAFVPEAERFRAYDDRALPIEAGQTISQPFIVALMAEAARLEPADRVLEIGTGSGYGAAVLSRLAGSVVTVERHPDLAETARRRLAALGYDTVEVVVGDGTRGWPDAAPFDAIVVTAGGPAIPAPLKEQLALDGRLIIPVGPAPGDLDLLRLTRRGPDSFDEDDLGRVAFVPLIGAHGWPDGTTPGRS
ncbi:protein-L-isoaspartate(D-aspartate) O-methyltransferase [Chthonobacter rhizosphaerae]|uniref:protein-L-isoaspartate(D-aspartate) O-methyltransferase n=1 Tax=Chthonobacter rhizosphaerae TaxID=2735553 RepID=UPI0015EEC4B2|nr:protein-L-isoaspartate(D-aspartate) O-methyltransferase [Chthonobacter rhizosphaerae]